MNIARRIVSLIAMLTVAVTVFSAATPAQAASQYDGNNPYHNWGGYTCADSYAILGANYITNSAGMNVGAVQIRYSTRCHTLWAQIFPYDSVAPGSYRWTLEFTLGNGEDYFGSYARSGGYTVMVDRVGGRSYTATGRQYRCDADDPECKITSGSLAYGSVKIYG